MAPPRAWLLANGSLLQLLQEEVAVSMVFGLDLTHAVQDEDVAHLAEQGPHEFLGSFGAALGDLCDERACLCRRLLQEAVHLFKGFVAAGRYRGAYAVQGATRRRALLLRHPGCLLVDLLLWQAGVVAHESLGAGAGMPGRPVTCETKWLRTIDVVVVVAVAVAVVMAAVAAVAVAVAAVAAAVVVAVDVGVVGGVPARVFGMHVHGQCSACALSLLLSLPLSLPVVSPLPLSLPFDFRSLDTHRLCHSRRGNRFYAGKVRHPVHLFQDLGLYTIIRDPGTAKNQHISCMGSNLCSLSGSISEAAASANGRSPTRKTAENSDKGIADATASQQPAECHHYRC